MARHSLARGVAAAALLAATLSVAQAHAFLDRAEPGVGSVLAAPPSRIKIWFTEALEPAFSTITVTDAQGRRVEQGRAAVDAGDPMLLEIGLPALAPGTYKVNWRVISIDTHPTQGDFTFTVEP